MQTEIMESTIGIAEGGKRRCKIHGMFEKWKHFFRDRLHFGGEYCGPRCDVGALMVTGGDKLDRVVYGV